MTTEAELAAVTIVIGRLEPDTLAPTTYGWWEAQQRRLIAATAPFDVITMGATVGMFRGRVEDQYTVVCVTPAWRAAALVTSLAERFERPPAVLVAPIERREQLWP